MKKKKLTETELAVLKCITDYMSEHKIPPTRRDIADMMGYNSANAAQDSLLQLQAKGWIELIPKASRGVVVL